MTPPVVDVANGIPDLSLYYFEADTSSSVVNGIFIDINGRRVGNAWSATVLTSASQSFADMYGAALPTNNDGTVSAVGAIIDATNDLVYDITTDAAATAKTNLHSNKAKHPTLKAGSNIAIGRVG